MIDQLFRIALLYDFYGELLTDRQRLCLERHYFEDMSLGEIAEELFVSRQAVHDIIKRSTDSLDELEEKLGCLARHQTEQGLLMEASALLEKAQVEGYDARYLAAAKNKIDSLIVLKGGE